MPEPGPELPARASLREPARGSRAALRNVDESQISYIVNVSGGKPGVADYEVDTSRIESQLPRGARARHHTDIALSAYG